MRYLIVEANSAAALAAEVNAYLDLGYELAGGVWALSAQCWTQALLSPPVTVTLPDDENKT